MPVTHRGWVGEAYEADTSKRRHTAVADRPRAPRWSGPHGRGRRLLPRGDEAARGGPRLSPAGFASGAAEPPGDLRGRRNASRAGRRDCRRADGCSPLRSASGRHDRRGRAYVSTVDQRARDMDTLGEVREVELAVSGMTCASCAARVEKALADQQSVHKAGVNLATSRARVVLDPTLLTIEDLEAAVDRIGYAVAPIEAGDEDDFASEEARVQAGWLRRVVVAWPLGLTVLVL